jgi:glutathione S-transferase
LYQVDEGWPGHYVVAMDKPKLYYFDAPASRGEECRLALHLAGVDFEDVRVKPADWPALLPKTPFGSMPVLELPGKPALGQSNAILVYVGRQYGLHPKDDFEAARHEAMMHFVEDLRQQLTPTMRLPEGEKKKRREELAAGFIPAWAANAEKQFGDGPFFGGAKLNVVDLKILLIVRWLQSGRLDHVPSTILAGYPKLNRAHDAVRDHAGVKAWYART